MIRIDASNKCLQSLNGAFIYFGLLREMEFKRSGPLFEALRCMTSSKLMSYSDTRIVIF